MIKKIGIIKIMNLKKKEIPSFGLCCMFYEEKIFYRSYTWKFISNLISIGKLNDARCRIVEVWEHNILTLQRCIDYCVKNEINSYRVTSDLFPHFQKSKEIVGNLEYFIKKLSDIKKYHIKLSLHPGQFVNMGSNSQIVQQSSLDDLKYHFFLAENIGFKEINIHLGGRYGDKNRTKENFCTNINSFFSSVQKEYITLENDEINYNILDVLEICEKLKMKCTFDIHHHRCYSLKEPTINEEQAFQIAASTWREGYCRVHLSSPKEGYSSPMKARAHSLFIKEEDFPQWILNYENVYMDIEAKGKERAIFKLRDYLYKDLSIG